MAALYYYLRRLRHMIPQWNWKGETLIGGKIVPVAVSIYWFAKYEPIEDEL